LRVGAGRMAGSVATSHSTRARADRQQPFRPAQRRTRQGPGSRNRDWPSCAIRDWSGPRMPCVPSTGQHEYRQPAPYSVRIPGIPCEPAAQIACYRALRPEPGSWHRKPRVSRGPSLARGIASPGCREGRTDRANPSPELAESLRIRSIVRPLRTKRRNDGPGSYPGGLLAAVCSPGATRSGWSGRAAASGPPPS
jgi:hypothetical protein